MKRLQRLRATAALRDMVSEIGFGQSQLIQPLFLSEAAVKEEPIAGLPGTSRHTLASLLTQFEKDLAAGVRQFLLFPVPAHKSNRNFTAEFVGTALGQMRQRAGDDAAIWVDTCLCSFTESGHCCVHDARGKQDLAATHSALGRARPHLREGRRQRHLALRHERRPRRASARHARWRRVRHRAHHELQHQVREQLLRAVPRCRGFRAAVRRPPQLSARRAQSQRCAGLQPPLRRRGRGSADGEARPAVRGSDPADRTNRPDCPSAPTR